MLPTRDPFHIETYIQIESKEMEKIFYANEMKKAGVAILISDNTDSKTGAIMRQRRAFHNEKEHNPTRGYNSCKNLYTQCRST